ncbi:hypothetical protein [Methylobacterium sp. 285MFTsu5.1]|uniref:hypothetical protein n=1 Tax=Methylobacterium sp. 285MFTsu5.1 TaxID=1172187 RepID=UPI00036BE34E|nr:hypothetical protein [Methylobacterium sp. 285MFTsu5.1]
MSATTDRIENILRVQLTGVLLPALRLELYLSIEELCRQALQIVPGPPAGAPDTWLTDDLWQLHQRLIIDGTLARLLAQPDKPYSHPELAAVHLKFWDLGLAAARVIAATTAAPTDGFDRLMANLRTNVPGARDPALIQELFNALDEACQTVRLWTQTATVTLQPGVTAYTVSASVGQIVEVVDVSHATLQLRDVLFDPASGMIDLAAVPDARDATTPAFALLRLVPHSTDDLSATLPDSLWAKNHQMLLDGALGRLMAQAAKPYSSPKLAEYHLRRFRNAMQQVRVATTGGGRAWRFPAAATRRSWR